MTNGAPGEGKDLVRIVADEAVAFSAPLIAAAGNPWARARMLEALGWDLTALTGSSEQELDTWFAGVEAALAALAAVHADQGSFGFDKLKRIAAEASKASAVASVPPLLKGTLPAGLSAEDMGVDLLTYLTVNRLHAASPVAYRVAVLLGLITPAADGSVSAPQPDQEGTPPVRLPRRRDTIHLDRVVDLLVAPGEHLKTMYLPDGVSTQADADRLASMAFPRIAAVLRELGVPARHGIADDLVAALSPAGVALSSHMLSIAGEVEVGALTLPLGATLALRYRPGSSGTTGTLGLVVVPRVGAQLSATLKRWRLELALDADAPGALEIHENGIDVHGAAPALDIRGRASRLPDASGFAFLLGPADGTHLAVGAAALEAFGAIGTGRDDFGVAAAAQQAEVVIRAGDGDAFLKRVLPPEGMRIGFDLGLAWSRRGGLVIAGGLSTAVTLPVHLGLGPFELESVYLALDGDVTSRTLSATAAVTVKLEIGAMKAVVERIGVTGELSFPQEGGGALGPVQIEPRFKAPSGIGLTVKAGPVKGGGYLFVDEKKGQYAGALELAVGDHFKLAALGLLNTKLPDGSPFRDKAGREAWSLIVVAAAQWKPIHIAFGVHIAGAGIVVGLHRTTDLPALRAGVRTKALDAVLFPPDPVGNAPQLLATLGTLFPTAPDRHVLGLMGRFTWGPESWLSLELALLLELPKPFRLVVLGRIVLKLPEKAPAAELRLDAVGILDLGTQEFSLDATFVDSKIAGMELTGDMLVRAAWGEKSLFVFSAGGFHPRYTPPPGLPEVRRLTLAILKGPSPKVTLTAYLAVTSNSLQIGARVEVHAAALGFSVDGHLVFDALLRWSPFGLDLYLEASVTLKRGDRTLMSVLLQLSLTGPEPWIFKGKASFSLWFIDGSVPVEGRWGPPEPERESPAPIDPTGRTAQALSDPGAWTVRHPSTAPSATLRAVEAEEGELLVDPLGQVGVRQAVLPLGIAVQRLSRTPLDRPRTVRITGARFGTSATVQGATPITAAFAPGEFFDLTDDQRLSRPDFEQLQAGAWFGVPARTAPTDPGLGVYTEVAYERAIIDAPSAPARAVAPEVLPLDGLRRAAATGPAAVAPVRRSGADRFANPVAEVVVREPSYTVPGLMAPGEPPDRPHLAPAAYTTVLDHFGGALRGEELVDLVPAQDVVR